MKKKIKISLILSLAIIFGCFSQVFAQTNQNNRTKKSIENSRNVKLTDGANDNEIDQYTKLLMHMDDDKFKDECGNNITNNNVILDTFNKKFGNGSAYLDGTSSYLYNASSIDFGITSNFTIDGWILAKAYPASGTVKTILSASNISSPNHSNRWSLYINANGKLQFDNGITSINFFSNTVLELNKFYHFAIEKNNKMLYLFINGRLENFINVSQEYTSINYIKIGSQMPNDRLFQGDIDELRVSNIARWVPINSIELNKTTDLLTLNDPIKGTDTLTAAVAPDNVTSKTVTWKSSDPNIATVDSTGKITALKAGTATITATTTDGTNLSKSCLVIVNNPTVITLDKTTDSINVGNTDKITASVTPAGQDVTWTSSDEGIVKVDQNGNITGLKAGTAIITATTADGKTALCTVTVKDQELGKSKLIIYMGNQATREYYLTEDEINNFINWYDARANDQTPKSYYVFEVPAQGVLPARKDYVLFNKIKAFEVE